MASWRNTIDELTHETEELQQKLTNKTEEVQQKLTNKTEEVQQKLTLLQSQTRRVDFLQPPMDHTDGIMKAEVAISVQDQVVWVHKFVLGSKSTVFCKMFEANMLESEKRFVRINDATFPVIRAVIEFCYNAKINFTYEVTAEEVLEVAHKYGINLLVKICEEQLIQTMDNLNLPKRLKLAKKFQAETLQAGAFAYLKTHYDDAIVAVSEELF